MQCSSTRQDVVGQCGCMEGLGGKTQEKIQRTWGPDSLNSWVEVSRLLFPGSLLRGWMRRLSQGPWELRFRRSTLRYHLTTHDSHTGMDASTGPRAAASATMDTGYNPNDDAQTQMSTPM
jgi:hypothetical protein